MNETHGPSRRNLLRGGVLGVGAIVGGAALTTAAPDVGALPETAQLESAFMYLKIPGFKGDVTQLNREHTIEIDGFTWGGQQDAGGQLASSILILTMRASTVSPLFAKALVEKQEIATATLRIYLSDKHGVEKNTQTFTFGGTGVTKWRQYVEDDGTLMDQVYMPFASVDFAFDPNDYTWIVPVPVH